MATAPRTKDGRTPPALSQAFAATIADVRAQLETPERVAGEAGDDLLGSLREAFASMRAGGAAAAASSARASGDSGPPSGAGAGAGAGAPGTHGGLDDGDGSGSTADATQAWDPFASPAAMREQVAKRRARIKEVISAADHNTGPGVSPSTDGSEVSELWLDGTWVPPPLLPLPNANQFWSEWTWTGDIDRFELVKSLRRSANRHGQALSEEELEYAVLTVETAEELSVQSKFKEALSLLLEVVHLCPSFTLGYYKVALLMLALGGPTALAQAKHPFRCAARLEPDNHILRGNIDLVLRVITGMPTQDKLWTAEYPKSQGDILALAACVMQSEGYQKRLAAANRESKRKRAAAAAERRMQSRDP